jgi:protein-tyrosine phosphatase
MSTPMNKYFLIILLLMPSLVYSEPRLRPEAWSQPIIGTRLKNIYLVDKGIYRSEQPGRGDLDTIKFLGIKEVLNLREFHSDKDDLTDDELKLHRVKIRTGNITEQQVIESLRIINNRRGPILIHCWHGSDRTGVIIAAYRVIFNHWSKSDALDEMVNGGYGYHAKVYPELVSLVENLDVNKIKRVLNH